MLLLSSFRRFRLFVNNLLELLNFVEHLNHLLLVFDFVLHEQSVIVVELLMFRDVFDVQRRVPEEQNIDILSLKLFLVLPFLK